jgi:hypothetical protein
VAVQASSGPLGLALEQTSPLAAELIAALEAAAHDAGLPVLHVRTADDERRVAQVIAIGHPWMYPDLLARARSARRTLWYGEWLPPIDSSDPGEKRALWQRLPHGRRLDAAARAALDVMLRASASVRIPRLEGALLRVKERAAIVREGERHLQELAAGAPAFDDVVVTSRDKAAGAARAGVSARVVPYGYHPRLCGALEDPSAPRDIPVLFLGGLATRGFRRGRILAQLQRECPWPIEVVHAGLHGAARHGLLRRVRVVIDIHRVPGNSAMLRWLHTSAAGAALVTEPLLDRGPLINGEHIIEAHEAHLRDAVESLLRHDDLRIAVAERSQSLLRGPLTMSRSLELLMSVP